jgi:O-acetyl-ADP-ribose deacetylase (regulator of RNase III)
MRNIQVKSEDITQTHADALITAINSGGMWFGGIDGAIQRVAGNLFHDQATAALPLSHGATVLAKGNSQSRGKFQNVVFVIDDLTGPLSQIITNGLNAASKAGLQSVVLPTIRMGVMLGVVEKSKEEAVSEMVSGVARFFEENPETSVTSITFVVYIDPETEDLLKKALSATMLA